MKECCSLIENFPSQISPSRPSTHKHIHTFVHVHSALFMTKKALNVGVYGKFVRVNVYTDRSVCGACICVRILHVCMCVPCDIRCSLKV